MRVVNSVRMNKAKLLKIKKECAKSTLGMHKGAELGHVGSSLSCLNLLVYLQFERMRGDDKLILSKGHAAPALYAVLSQAGKIPKKELATFCGDGSHLAGHPPCTGGVNGIIFGTGSLGHGLSLSNGIALSTRFTNKKFKVYCVLSDGDCDEGSNWEAIEFAAQHKLSNLVVIVDKNGLQGFGVSKDILDLEPLKKKLLDFGWEVVEAERGNELESLDKAFNELDKIDSDKPRCIIAHTIKGAGISFMENKFEWHYLKLTDEQYQQALKEVEGWDA